MYYASSFWSVLLTNIGDIRSESVHDINKIRARCILGRTKPPRHVGDCTYFVDCILFILGRIRAGLLFFVAQTFEIFERDLSIFDLSNFTILQICLRVLITVSLFLPRKLYTSMNLKEKCHWLILLTFRKCGSWN